MALSFQKSHSNFCRKSRTPPFAQADGPEQIVTLEATTKSPFRGCPMLKSQASLTFHRTSYYAAFENRPPWLARRTFGGAWDSSKGRIFRIKPPLPCAVARVAVCVAMASWYPLPSGAADCSEGRVQLRSRYGLEKSAVPSPLTGSFDQGNPQSKGGALMTRQFSLRLEPLILARSVFR